MRSARQLRSVRPAAFVALVVVTLLAMTGIALAATDPNILPPPRLQPNDGAIQRYCDEEYPGTTGIVFSTGSATTNSQGALTKTEAGYTLTWVESTEATDDYDIRVLSITEEGSSEPLQFSVVFAFLGGNDLNAYEYVEPVTTDDLNVGGGNGQNVTHFGFCAITTGEIIVEKVTDPSPSTNAFDFTASWDADGFTLADGESISSGRLDDGTYSVAEILPVGWDLTSATCDDGSPVSAIDLQIAETVTCTFVNQADANIIIEKQTEPDGSTQQFTFSTNYGDDFQLTDGQTNDSGDLDPDTYSVTETFPDGWEQTSVVCSDGSEPDNIVLSAGETVTCVFTNRQDAFITVVKQTDPGGSQQAFTFSSDYGPDFDLADGESSTSDGLAPDTYSVSETVPDGWDLDFATCDNGDTPDAITVAAGDNITCTFVNQADANIIVVKETDPGGSPLAFTFDPSWGDDFDLADGQSNDSGDIGPGTYSVSETVRDGWDLLSATCDDGSDPSAIGLSAGETVTCTFLNQEDSRIIVEKQTDPDGSSQLFDFTASWDPDGFSLIDDGQEDSGDLSPGTYSVSETELEGWELESVECTGNQDPAAIELLAGQTVTCVFTNQADANIIVVKETDPGGSEQAFTFSTDYSDDFDLADGESNDSGDLDPGTYSVSETVPDGWELDSVECSDGSDPSSIELLAGQTVTCVFTNQADANIIVEKQTDPDGSKQLFTFTTNYGDDFQLADNGTNDSGDIGPGTYSVSETVPDGWELTDVICDDDRDPSAIELVAGETVTCTFYNEADSAIIVQKVTDPDDSTELFTFDPSWGDDFQLGNGDSSNSGKLDPGLYSVTETVPTGWDPISATCNDGSNPAAINLGAGDVVTCTFVNQADANIIVEKQTDPDGSPVLFDFTASWDDDGFKLADDGREDSGDLDPDIYSVSETVPDGWEQTSVECTSNIDGQDPYEPDAIDLSAGETVTCVFTNQEDANIVVVKETDPDGSPVEFDFTASWDNDGFKLADGDSEDSGDLEPGTYSVAETVPDGWNLVAALCDDNSPVDAIELTAGETVICTFSNQQLGRIIVEKETDPIDAPDLFTFTPSWGDEFQLAGGQSNNSGYLDPGPYQVSETVPEGWDLESATCDDGSPVDDIDLDAGDVVTCTFRNQADAKIVVEKQTNPDGSTEAFTFSPDWGAEFQLSDGQTKDSGDLDPGIYSVSEIPVDGWDLSDATCTDDQDPDAIDLVAGATVTCVFTNTQRGMVELLKLNNGVEETTVAWTFTLEGPEVDTSDTTPPALLDFGGAKLIPGETYTVCETGVPAGWSTEWTVDGAVMTPYDPNAGIPDASNDTWCVDITVEPGQTLGIVVNNVPPPGGGQRTPGYWKNWNTCSTGNQARTAERNGGAEAGFYLLDDVLPMTIGSFEITDCETGRLLLDRRDLEDQRNRKRASDAAYNLASHLIAAQANVTAGASVCPEVTQAIADANALLASIGFDGAGKYLEPKDKSPNRQLALEIAALLDAYNNGEVC